MDLRPSEGLSSSPINTTSVQATGSSPGADTAPALATAGSPAEAGDTDGWLPRIAVELPERFADGVPGMSLPSSRSGSYARLYASPGPHENRRAALSYFPLVAFASFFDKHSTFYRRFHAAQALSLTLVALSLIAVHWLIFGALDGVQVLAMVFVEIALTWLFIVACAALAVLWFWGILAALSGKDTLLPLVGRLAERILAWTLSRQS